MDSLFAQTITKPLADRMRPRRLSDFAGQEKALGPGSPLRRMIERDALQPLLFYGPPGTGKTTLAHIIANMTQSRFVALNAVSSGVPELRRLIGEARDALYSGMGRTIVFIDEIHRFNKAQQDVLLPYVENGTVILIGATTENPFFEVNAPLLSRMKIIRLERLDKNAVKKILQKALTDKENGYGRQGLAMTDEALEALADFCGGDARVALNLLEQAEFMLPDGVKTIDGEVLKSVMGDAFKRYDKKGDRHYETVSAFIKSMRGSDADAALHYLARLLEAGDLASACRRLMVCACEDVGLAWPQIIPIVKAAVDAAMMVGLPEARIPLADAVILTATAPKSNSGESAIDAAMRDVKAGKLGVIPRTLQNVHYDGSDVAKKGQFYRYPHDYPDHWLDQQYLPDALLGASYYHYGDNKNEQAFKAYWENIKRKHSS